LLIVLVLVLVVVVVGHRSMLWQRRFRGRRDVNGGSTSAVLVPEKSRTKDDHEDEDDLLGGG
jgi:hypothetical protein